MLCCDKSEFKKNWKAPFQFLDSNPSFSEDDAQFYIQSDDEEDKVSGYIITAALAYRNKDKASLLAVFEKAQEDFGELPEVLRVMRLSFHAINDDLAEAAFNYAFKSFESKRYDQALEEMRIAFVADYRSGNNILNDPLRLQKAMTMYKNIANSLDFNSKYQVKENDAKFRIGILVPNLVDESVAYSKRVMFFARYLDRKNFELKVYSSEDLARDGSDSYARAPKYIKELKESRVDFWMTDPDSSMIDAAKALADKLEEDNLDALLMQTDPAMPIAWMAAYVAQVPVKVQIHIGSAIYLPGLNKVLYDNETVMKQDTLTWPSDVGEQLLLRRGTDIVFVDEVKGLTKQELGLGDDVVLVGCLSNHLDHRMSEDYKRVIVQLMAENSMIYFMPIGEIRDESSLSIFNQKGLSERLVLPGARKDAAVYLKALDIYAAEFPEGGSQALVEAMACSLPIVAMRCGQSHHKSISSEIVGDEWAIKEYDIATYKERLSKLIENYEFRKENATAMRKRAVDLFSIEHYVDSVCTMLKEIKNDN